jgi:hypothetical protein
MQIKIYKVIISFFFNGCELGFPPEQKRVFKNLSTGQAIWTSRRQYLAGGQ